MTANPLIENDQLVDGLRGALREGESGLRDVPRMLRLVLEEGAWEKRYDRLSRTEVTFDSFDEFVAAQPTKGLGADVGLVYRVVGDDIVTRDLLDRVRQRPASLHRALDNIQSTAPSGTSQAAALRRLRKDRPDLHERVLSGELSANGAAVEAGFRPKTATIRLDDPHAIARALRKRLSPEDIADLIAALLDVGAR